MPTQHRPRDLKGVAVLALPHTSPQTKDELPKAPNAIETTPSQAPHRGASIQLLLHPNNNNAVRPRVRSISEDVSVSDLLLGEE